MKKCLAKTKYARVTHKKYPYLYNVLYSQLIIVCFCFYFLTELEEPHSLIKYSFLNIDFHLFFECLKLIVFL